MQPYAEPEKHEPTYSYSDCLEKSYRVNWTIHDLIEGQQFDLTRRWLPAKLSAANGLTCLTEDEKTRLTHVEMGAYAHLFGFVEEFIAPQMSMLALDFKIDNREGFDALTNFAAEEVKHMNLFRAIRRMVDSTIGTPLTLLGNEKDVARFVLSKNTGAVLLLTAAIEWFTQLHYTEAFKDDESLDAFTKRIFKFHWLEESQHARMDHLETLRAFKRMTDDEKDQAINDLIELAGAVDGLLQQQAKFDVQNLEKYLGRTFKSAEADEVYSGELRAKRYCFLESGVTHPNFLKIFGAVTNPAQQARVQTALKPILG